MTNILYTLLLEIEKMEIQKNYIVSFIFNDSPKDTIKLKMQTSDGRFATSWVISKKEIELIKLDFIRDHILAMIDHLDEKCKEAN